VKPFTPEVRAEIDNELTDKSIAFMRAQKAAGKPFFLYLPFSMGHSPNYPSKQFAGKSRIGQYGDKTGTRESLLTFIGSDLVAVRYDTEFLAYSPSQGGVRARGERGGACCCGKPHSP
jgi:hypothetical protein